MPSIPYLGHFAYASCVLRLNTVTGELTLVRSVDGGVNPCYAAFDRPTGTAYFINEHPEDGAVRSFRVDAALGLHELNSVAVAGHVCFVSVEKASASASSSSSSSSSVLCASYISGHVHRFPIDGGKGHYRLSPSASTRLLPSTPGDFPGPIPARQEAPHAHCYVPLPRTAEEEEGSFAICCDLGADRVFCLRTADGSVAGRSTLPKGSGPRHVAIYRGGSTGGNVAWLCVSTELANTLVVIAVDLATGQLSESPDAVVSVLPEKYDGPPTTASHVELSPDGSGRFAYVGNRVGVDVDGGSAKCAEGAISVIDMNGFFDSRGRNQGGNRSSLPKLVDFAKIGGKVPRSFCVVPPRPGKRSGGGEGGWLVVGAQESSFVKSYRIDADSGKLGEKSAVGVPSPGFVGVGPAC